MKFTGSAPASILLGTSSSAWASSRVGGRLRNLKISNSNLKTSDSWSHGGEGGGSKSGKGSKGGKGAKGGAINWSHGLGTPSNSEPRGWWPSSTTTKATTTTTTTNSTSTAGSSTSSATGSSTSSATTAATTSATSNTSTTTDTTSAATTTTAAATTTVTPNTSTTTDTTAASTTTTVAATTTVTPNTNTTTDTTTAATTTGTPNTSTTTGTTTEATTTTTEAATTTTTVATTTNPILASSRLRLYWEEGYRWQGSRDETFWCMECNNNCRENDSVYVDVCDRSTRQQFSVVGDTIRPTSNPTLCLTATGYYSEDKPIRIKRCKQDEWDQKFVGFDDNGRFEIQPKGREDLCVSQMHHPKPFERVYPESCSKTRKHDTTYWVKY
mmetsp:Transcript_36091/g.87134  ORF Transcript_36091/g.87134 Transcript_36091/m.87134 type:complete len:384 (+) Transcript_36091:168-1319(+)